MTYQQNINIAFNLFYMRCQDDRAVQGARLKVNHLPSAQWERAFWSPNGGVGSNPTPDKL